jgi:signal transduction histidine kinase
MHRLALATVMVALPLAGLAEDRPTTKQAESMVHSAVAFMAKEGKEKALAVFNDPKGPFTHGSLYISAVTLDGIVLANGGTRGRVGKRYINLTPEEFTERFKTIVQQKKGWLEYKWPNPTSGAVEQKVAYVEMVGDVFLACGAYLSKP